MDKIHENKNVGKSLKRYINSRDEFAFLLNGPWGSGKTFFIKHFLDNLSGDVTSTYFSLNEADNVNNLYSEILYKICVGPGKLSDIKELTNDVFEDGNGDKLLGKLSFVPKLANSIAKLSMEKIIGSKKNHQLLVLDDLERFLNQKDIDINEFVGVITKLLNHNIKIIMIADETKIEKNSKKFNLVKEKIINKTIDFTEYNYGSAIEIIKEELKYIFKDFENETRSEFYKWIEHFYSYVKNEKQINLRMIKSVMFSFDEIVHESKDSNFQTDLLETLLENSFLSIYIYTNIYWNNKSKLEINDVRQFMDKRFKQLIDLMVDENQKTNICFGKFFKNFILNINDNLIKNNILLTEEILTLVTKDEFNFQKYISDIKLMLLFDNLKQDKENQEKQKNQEDETNNRAINILIANLNNINAESEKELKKLEDNAISFIEKENVDFIKRLALYDSLYGLKKDELYFSKMNFDSLTNLIKNQISWIDFEDYEIVDGIKLTNSYIKIISNDVSLKEKLNQKVEFFYQCYCRRFINILIENHVPKKLMYVPSEILYDEINNYDNLLEKIVNNTEFGYRLVKFVNDNNFNYRQDGVDLNDLSLGFYKHISGYKLDNISDKLKRYKYNLFKTKCNEAIAQLERTLNQH